jgi:hypothetical protein
MIPLLSLLVVLAVPTAAPAPEIAVPARVTAEASAPLEIADLVPLAEALGVTDNCFIRCDNGINVDTWVSPCEECAQAAYANCNQQGTYGGYFWGPGCSDFW